MKTFLEKNIVVGPFQCNCRLLVCLATGKALLVDPGDEAARLIREIEQVRTPSGDPIEVEYLLHTHAHLDHIGASRDVAMAVRSAEGAGMRAKIALHREDHPLYLALKMQGSLFGKEYDDPLAVDHFIEHEESLKVGEMKLRFIHTPGHSPGSVCIRLSEDSAKGIPETVYSGDTLFQGSVGRTDLWGANQESMFDSIKGRLLTLDDEIRLCPGHGPQSSIGEERRNNPFLRDL